MAWTCPTCSREFDTYRGYSTHHRAKHEGHALVAWYGEKKFKELSQSMSTNRIKEEIGVSQPTVENAVESIDIDYPINCPDCDSGFADYYSYTKHFQQIHDGHPLVALHGEDRLQQLYSEMSENELSDELDVSRTAIREALLSIGVERRGMSQAERFKNEKKSLKERREQTRKARQKSTEKFGDGGYIAKWVSENKEQHRELAQKYAARGTEARDENGMEGVTGQEHPAWRGGKSIYDAVKKQLHGESWANIRERVREDAGHGCEMCGKPASEIDHRGLDVHHIVPIMCGGTNGDWNLMALCATCHRKTEIRTRELLDPVLDAESVR